MPRAGIIRSMRRAVAMILGLLLVLRGLMGDAMAMGVAPVGPVPQAATASAPHAGHAGKATAHDHVGQHDHVLASPQSDCCGSGDDAHAEHPAGCSACGICHSAFSAPAWMATLPDVQNGAVLPRHRMHFASATAAQAIKPPIS